MGDVGEEPVAFASWATPSWPLRGGFGEQRAQPGVVAQSPELAYERDDVEVVVVRELGRVPGVHRRWEPSRAHSGPPGQDRSGEIALGSRRSGLPAVGGPMTFSRGRLPLSVSKVFLFQAFVHRACVVATNLRVTERCATVRHRCSDA